MIGHDSCSQIDSLEHDVRELNDDVSDLRRDLEQYDDEQRAAIRHLTAQVRSLIELTNRIAPLTRGSGHDAPPPPKR